LFLYLILRNSFTKGIDYFKIDFEVFLGIPKPKNRSDKKPLNVMWHYFQNKIKPEILEQLKTKIAKLL